MGGAPSDLDDEALTRIDPGLLRIPDLREALLDEAWAEFTSEEALAAAQLWSAVWREPDLAETLRALEDRIGAILVAAVALALPQVAGHERLVPVVHAAVALIRGLVLAVPIWGPLEIDARWDEIKPLLLSAFEHALDRD